MTREEAIVYFESLLKRFEEMRETETSYWGKVHTETTIEATRVALSALRPVSREQVEGIRGEWMFPIFADQEDENDPRCQCSECGSIETPLARHRFCPACGAPMTDEAVQMVMDRMEEMENG